MIGDSRLDLSIIIPTLNEARELPHLLSSLDRQTSNPYEVIIVDGGSVDETCGVALQIAPSLSFRLRVVKASKGRAAQLNVGVEQARGRFLLFLHADSRFADVSALETSLDALRREMGRLGHERVAGHFRLQFDVLSSEKSFAYDFFEAKAALNRPGCTHGDQGFLISRDFWGLVGPFDVARSVLEDTFFAERVRSYGQWFLLPAQVRTSARRFEVEGLWQRQTLNALIMNFAAIGWDEFFLYAPDLYRQQDRTSSLRLKPFFVLIRRLLSELSCGCRLRLWYRTGAFVLSNAWQVAFYFDVRRARRREFSPIKTDGGSLRFFDAFIKPLSDNFIGKVATAILVWFWFHWNLVGFGFSEKN